MPAPSISKLPTVRKNLDKEKNPNKITTTKTIRDGIPWRSSGYDSMFPLQGAQVQFLAGELRSFKLCGTVKKKRERETERERIMVLT